MSVCKGRWSRLLEAREKGKAAGGRKFSLGWDSEVALPPPSSVTLPTLNSTFLICKMGRMIPSEQRDNAGH